MSDERPLAATGHLFLPVHGVKAAAERLVALGVRPIVVREGIAVLELRGGTHIVVQPSEEDRITKASFDLMYDDIDAMHARFQEQGFTVTDIKDGRIHRSFHATAPERFRIQVLDSHAGSRVV